MTLAKRTAPHSALFGDPRLPRRFWAKIQVTESGCWLWTGAVDGKGYARFHYQGRNVRAHRLAYETLVAPVPEELVLDHDCRVRGCVNPADLEPATSVENTMRTNSVSPSAVNARKTHCAYGHPFSGDNLMVNHYGRRCRTCTYRRNRESRARARGRAER